MLISPYALLLGTFFFLQDGGVPGDDADLHRQYGFDGLIVSKFQDGIFGLRSADLNGDGHGDLAFVNNGKARIELLLHRGDEPLAVEELELINELPDEAHFRRESIATEQKVWALDLSDMDGDGRADVIFSGDSGKLTIAYAGEDGGFERRTLLDLEGGISNPGSVRAGDLDGDGRNDVVVLTEASTDLFVQDAEGRLRAEARLPNATDGSDGFMVADLNGDGALDLIYVASDSDWPVRFRLGQGQADFGPEMRSRSAGIRGISVDDLDDDGRSEVIVIGRRSGRAIVMEVAEKENSSGDLPLSSLRIVPFSELKDADSRGVALADLDRDGYPDLIVSEPSAARLVVYHGGTQGQFGGAQSYPSLLGSRQPRVADLDDDGLLDIAIAAPDENAVAQMAVDPGGDLSFPETIGAPGGDLLGLDVGDVSGDGLPEVWIVVGEGRGRSRDRVLRQVGAGVNPDQGGTVKLDMSTDPSDLLLADFDRDGRDDVMLIVPTELPQILLTRDDGPLLVDPKTPGLGILENKRREAMFFGDVNGDGTKELLVPGSNFARAIYLDAEGAVEVVAQYNLEDASASVGAVAAADLEGSEVPEIVLVDDNHDRLMVLGQEQDEGRIHVLGHVDLGGFGVKGVLPADVDADGRSDLLLWNGTRFATIQVGGEDPVLVEGKSYESPVKDAYLDTLAVGDVNGDGEADLVFTETRKHLMHIAAVQPEGLKHAMKFPVYEARMFESSRRASREPREVLVADLTGDGLDDIAILVHDRLIVYPQEAAR